MRKRKRAAQQLKTARNKAKAVAENSDLSEKQKIKVINDLHDFFPSPMHTILLYRLLRVL
jgi:hypothetical protein